VIGTRPPNKLGSFSSLIAPLGAIIIKTYQNSSHDVRSARHVCKLQSHHEGCHGGHHYGALVGELCAGLDTYIKYGEPITVRHSGRQVDSRDATETRGSDDNDLSERGPEQPLHDEDYDMKRTWPTLNPSQHEAYW